MTSIVCFTDLWKYRRIRAGLLDPYLDQYLARLIQRGYRPSSTRANIVVVAGFGCWLERQQLRVSELDEAIAERYYRHYCVHVRYVSLGARAALSGFLSMLREMDVCRSAMPAVVPPTPSEQLIEDYKHFLLQERGLNPVSVSTHARLVRRFLHDRCGGDALRLDTLTGQDITGFVTVLAREYTAKGCTKRFVQQLCSALRSFLRYLLFRGKITAELATCVPTVALRRFATVPPSLSPRQIQQLLDHCDRRTAPGKRDYAILLLLTRLGLRANEVATLRLDDIDWHSGCLTVHAKGRQRAQMPLPHAVGEAIGCYLRQGRPRSVSRRVFLRHHAPRVGFLDAGSIGALVFRALKRAGIESKSKGAHLLRHSFATQMLRSGASLTEIGQVLRHRHLDTTRIYAKVDLKALRAIAVAWPGGVS